MYLNSGRCVTSVASKCVPDSVAFVRIGGDSPRRFYLRLVKRGQNRTYGTLRKIGVGVNLTDKLRWNNGW